VCVCAFVGVLLKLQNARCNDKDIYHGNSSSIKVWQEKRVLHIQTNVHLWSYLA